MQYTHSFNIDDESILKTIIDDRGDHYVIPLYIKTCGENIPILDLKETKLTSIPPSSFSIVFGTSNTMKTKFNQDILNAIINWYDVDILRDEDENTGVVKTYYIFNANSSSPSDILNKEIDMWDELLYNKIKEIADINRSKMISEQMKLQEESLQEQQYDEYDKSDDDFIENEEGMDYFE